MPVISIRIFGCLNERIPNYSLILNMTEFFDKACKELPYFVVADMNYYLLVSKLGNFYINSISNANESNMNTEILINIKTN